MARRVYVIGEVHAEFHYANLVSALPTSRQELYLQEWKTVVRTNPDHLGEQDYF